ncbi:MAG: hypothetical protein OHK0046_32460 [Anaerolineae bacterium]
MTTLERATWEKPAAQDRARLTSKTSGRWKFLVGGILILASVAYLVISSTLAGARFFITVDEVVSDAQYAGKTVRVSGAVLGETIEYDPETLTITFTMSHIPREFDNLAEALNQSVNDPTMTRLTVVVENEVMPDLLQHEAQAIVSGELGADGIFYANELLLKCPSRFDDGSSNDALGENHPDINNAR